MDTKDVILELRTKNGLSQDELAEKLYVTRQAVSRWENGETIPNTETLKLLSKFFDVSINTLLGTPRKLICQCCGMPLDDDAIISHNYDGTFNEDYCKWCYADGTYTYNDMDDLIEVCVKNMVSENFTEEQVRSYLKGLLPKLDYWKRYDELSDNGQFEEFKQHLIREINELHIEGMPKVKCVVVFVENQLSMEMTIMPTVIECRNPRKDFEYYDQKNRITRGCFEVVARREKYRALREIKRHFRGYAAYKLDRQDNSRQNRAVL